MMKAITDMGNSVDKLAAQKRRPSSPPAPAPQERKRRKGAATGHDLSDDSEDDVAELVGSDKSKPPETASDEEDFLDAITTELLEEEPAGPEVSTKLAKIVNNRFTVHSTKETIINKEKACPMPQNCEKLIVPKLNDEIRSKINAGTKSRDVRLYYIQKAVVKGIPSVIYIDDLWYKKEGNRECETSGMVVNFG
jgi:hypothetical protein